MTSKSVLLLVSRSLGYECLKHALDLPKVSIGGVVSAPDDKQFWWGKGQFQALCKERNISWFSSDAPLEQAVEQSGAEVLFSILYPRIIKGELLAKLPAYNIHCAPLPKYKGYNSSLWAILNGDKEYGVTLHEMVEAVDAGNIVDEIKFPIPDQATNQDLYHLAHQNGLALFKRNITSIATSNPKKAKAQTGPGKFYARTELPTRQIDPTWPKTKIDRTIRAFHFPPFEPAYILEGTKKQPLPYQPKS